MTTAKKTLVVGDVHGCRQELQALVELAAISSGDRVVLVGDLVAKGPDSAGVLRLCRQRGFLAVLGNHDAHVLRGRAGDPKVKGEHLELARTLEPESLQWLQALPLYLRVPEHGALVVHAGLLPGVPLEQQSREDLLTLRSITPSGTGSKRVDGGTPWGSLWPGPEHVLFGHDALRGLQEHPHATGLDTGCVYGGRLTGMLLPERRLLSVPAVRVYQPVDD